MKFVVLFLFSFSAMAAPVTLNFTQTMGKKGKIFYAVFDKASQFPRGTPVTAGSVDAEFLKLDLPAGEYAVSVFLDENNNGRLDQNVLGIPRERFGFSNNPRILTGPPSYRDCAVRVLDQENDFEIRLIKLF